MIAEHVVGGLCALQGEANLLHGIPIHLLGMDAFIIHLDDGAIQRYHWATQPHVLKHEADILREASRADGDSNPLCLCLPDGLQSSLRNMPLAVKQGTVHIYCNHLYCWCHTYSLKWWLYLKKPVI